MCGRFGFAKGIDDFSKKFHIPMEPRYNIAPSQQIVAVNESFSAFKAQWSFLPSWSTSTKPLINARIETLDEKPSFKGYQKCLIPASGWFEWKRSTTANIPYYFTTTDDWFYMGGIIIENQIVILTKEADQHLESIHHRMPLIYANSYDKMWELDQINHKLAESIVPYSVSDKINKANYDYKDLLTPIDYPSQGSLFNF